MRDIVRPFNELIAEQQPSAGGKGGTLARLYQAGYPVPDGFVILPAAFAGDKLILEAWTQVQAHLRRMGADNGVAFAVRSSALSEDSARTSFAGEFETVLDVRTGQEIHEAIHTVRRSRQSERVQGYSQAQGMATTHEVAVVVQQLIRAEISGVMFTADPVTGSSAHMTGNFVYGLGEQLVSGQANADTFTLARPKGKYDGPPELRRFARRLYKLGSRLEKELGCPQDVEWAIAGGKLYLLQSRPITTLIGHNPATGEWNDSLTGDFLWSNVNFGEAIPDVMTPFTWSALQRGALAERISFQGHRPYGNIGGRVYLNISVFASIFHTLGKNTRQALELIEGTLHLRLPEGVEIPLIPASKRVLLNIIPMIIAAQWQQRQDVKNLPALLATNPAWCRDMQCWIEQVGTETELVTLWEEAIKPRTTQVWSSVLSSANHYADYTAPLRRELAKQVGPDDADALISGMSSPSELLASLGPVVGLSKIVRGKMTREAYLEQYGHRGPHEFEFSTPRPAEDPTWLDRQLVEFEKSPVDVEALLAKQHAEFEAAWQRLRERYPRQANSIKRRIDQVASRARLREDARSEFARIAWVWRTWALRAGELTGLGEDVFFLTIEEVLKALTGDEKAFGYIPARQETYKRYKALPSYPPIIKGRFDPCRWAADPNRRSDIFDSHASIPAPDSDDVGSNLIIGAAGAAGQVEGLVRRLDSPEEGGQLQPGEILVTAQTNIGWTLLFPRAAAIVTDVGAPLSHAAIVARELGIPAVVGCGDATTRLRTGDRVLVDGGQGLVEILEGV